MAIYDAAGKKISAAKIKATIMKAHGWTSEQYRKQYDIFKNKLRAYESFRRAHGAKFDIQSPQEVLYKQAKAMNREGPNYTPSREMQRIQSFSAVSITKGRKLAEDLESTYSRRKAQIFAATTSRQFAQFIKDVPKAKEIDETITDPVAKEEALKALAEHIHAKQKETGEVFAGEVYGSDDAGDDFDYGEWLE